MTREQDELITGLMLGCWCGIAFSQWAILGISCLAILFMVVNWYHDIEKKVRK